MLTDSKPHGKYRVDGDSLPPGGSAISRADLADCMMRQIGNRIYDKVATLDGGDLKLSDAGPVHRNAGFRKNG